MFELPDKRAILIFAILGIVFAANAIVSPESAMAVPVDALLYGAVICAGAAFTAIDLREGFCINRPSITREGSPLLYFLEIAASIFLMGVGAYKLWSLF